MDRINEWFAQHPDAILVTDKLDDPKKLIDTSTGFKHLDRCIAELFSWKSLEIAQKNNLVAMASSNVVFDFEKEQSRIKRFLKKRKLPKKLQQLEIKYIAIPHGKATHYSDLINNLRKRGIKVCVYNVNDKLGNNEGIIYDKYFNSLIDGMYIDDMSFLRRLSNKN